MFWKTLNCVKYILVIIKIYRKVKKFFIIQKYVKV